MNIGYIVLLCIVEVGLFATKSLITFALFYFGMHIVFKNKKQNKKQRSKNKMTIEEMKAKGYLRYTAFIEKQVFTKEVEVWARDWDDAREILENATEELPDFAFEIWHRPDIQQLEHSAESPYPIAAAQSTVTDFNEDFYKHEEE